MTTFSKKYEPSLFEEGIYKNWEESWDFEPKKSITWDSFYIPMPPPNVTSKLHIWHSVMLTLEDIMTRYHRMKGDSTLLLPGTDHAWIATQVKVEEKLAKAWKSKYSISREEFLQECWDWTKEYGWQIQNQFRKMWTSCDWSKEKFTFEHSMNKKVNKAFVELYKKGLIYQWEYMVNYDPVLKTVVSNQEVVYKEEKWKLYHITYFVSGSDFELVVATTRPETLLWDVAVAVNPNDKRYKKLLKWGYKLILPIINKEIPIIADEMVDMEFGTWAVKITPAHDPNDFDVAKRHDLPLDQVVVDKDWTMSEAAGQFAGQDVLTARENIVELLKAKWNLTKIEDYNHKVGYWERSHARIETFISTQWFVKVQPLVDKVIAWYEKKEFDIVPQRYNKTFQDWIYNLNDWCISRQLIWWHRIPVWYWEDWEIFCAETQKEASELAKAHYWKEVELTQDNDTLDTWFSSGLWPFATLDHTMEEGAQNDLINEFYPASVLETGHDIIFFWVIRMLLFWYEFTGQTPFKTIYLHGLVKDAQGRKMSKSLWNWVDPLDMIEKYGTDALRMTLSIWNTPWNDLKFDESNVEQNKIFINKLWNATRFVYTNLFEKSDYEIIEYKALENKIISNYDSLLSHEKWILSKLKNISDKTNEAIEKFNFSETWMELQNFTKNDFCDYYIEEFKITADKSQFGQDVIMYVINNLLKLWHPFIPFVSEELWNKIGFEGKLINASSSKVEVQSDKNIEKNKNILIEVIKEVRNIRAVNQIMPNKTIKLFVKPKKSQIDIFWEDNLFILSWILNSEETTVVSKKQDDDSFVYWVTKTWVEIFVDATNAIDKEAEVERLKLQINDTKEYILILDKKLLNESFVRNAPADLVRKEMEKKSQALEKLSKLEEKLKKIK